MAETAAPAADGMPNLTTEVPNLTTEAAEDTPVPAAEESATKPMVEDPSAAPLNESQPAPDGQTLEDKKVAEPIIADSVMEGEAAEPAPVVEKAEVTTGDVAIAEDSTKDKKEVVEEGTAGASEACDPAAADPAALPSAPETMEEEKKESGSDEEVVKEVVTKEVVSEAVEEEVKAVVHEEVKEEEGDVGTKEVILEGGVTKELAEASEEEAAVKAGTMNTEEAKRSSETLERTEDVQPEKKKQKVEGEVSNGELKLGPKVFRSSMEMYDYFFDLLHGWSVNHDVNKYEFMVLNDLLHKGHVDAPRKVGCGVKSFQVRLHPQYDTRCYYVLRKDNSFEDFSYRKCIDKLMGLPKELLGEVSGPKGKGGGRGGGGGRWRGGRGGGRGYRGGRRGGRNW